MTAAPASGFQSFGTRTLEAFAALKQKFEVFQKRLTDGFMARLVNREAWGAVKPRRAIPGQTPRKFVLHHTGELIHFTTDEAKARQFVKSIQNNHMNQMVREHRGKNMDDIGYHFLISASGTIYEGRWPLLRGSHAKDAGNHDSIGIALLGEFSTQQPTAQQLAALNHLLGFLAQEFHMDPTASSFLQGHEHYSHGRNCPGTNLMRRLEWFRASAARSTYQAANTLSAPAILSTEGV